MTNLILYKIVFVFEIYICELIFGITLKKQSKFVFRLLGGIILNVGFALLLGLLPQDNVFVSTLIFPLIFSFSILVLKFCFKNTWSTVTFIAFAAYTVQHFSYELTSFIMSLIVWDRPPLYNMYNNSEFSFWTFDLHTFIYCWIYFFCFVGTNILFYYLFAKRIERRKDFSVKADAMLIFVGVGLFIDILFNSLVVAFGNNLDIVTGLINNLYNCFCCLLLLYALFTMIDSRRVRKENEMLQALWQRAEEQYNLSKENIELINLKCHDLKHQIHAIETNKTISPNVLSEIEDSIGFYDSFVKTENEALNVILTEKSIRCHKNDIALSVIADGKSMNFMNEVDIYSLFGNAFDNAIEAVMKIDNATKRVISLSIKNEADMLSIVLSNSFTGEIKFDNYGNPITTKDNNGYHGFGTKSIIAVSEKYGGLVNFKVVGNVFYLYILFPINKN